MSHYKPYPKYRPSGVEWLGEVPEGWAVSRIKNVATINASKSEVSHLDPETEISFLPMDAVGDDGSLDTSTTRQLGDVLTGYTYVRENDVLVAKITPCFENGKGCIARGLNNGIGFATTEVVPIRPNKRSIPEFLYFLLHGIPFRKVAEGSMYGAGGQKRVSDTFVAGYSFALPPLPEQIQIAAFLDRECGKLDALQAKQERLIELLKEKRQALISHAVTKGLDPSAKLKPSGIEWLGDVPVHWDIQPLSYVCRFQSGKAHEPFIDDDGEFVCVNSRFVSTEGESRKFCSRNLSPAKPGDILMVMSDLPNGRALAKAYFVSENEKLAVNQRVCILTAYSSDPKFLYYYLDRNQGFLRHDDGVSQTHLSNSDFTKLKLPVPPIQEQRAIVTHLDEKCGKIDQLKAKAERGIELLKERRSALISAAVTGKIDVRTAVNSQ